MDIDIDDIELAQERAYHIKKLREGIAYLEYEVKCHNRREDKRMLELYKNELRRVLFYDKR